MFQTLKSWLTSTHTTQAVARPNPRRFAPQVEAMPDRITPSVSIHADGHLVIGGTSFDDLVTVVNNGSFYRVTEDNNIYLSQPTVTDVPIASVTGHIAFYGFDGDDSFANGTAERTYAYGGNGDDLLRGGSERDYLYGQAGADKLMGHGGSDNLYGGTGNDRLYSAGDRHFDLPDTSHNTLDGGDGNDSLFGSEGNDTLRGRNGDDHLFGRGGADNLQGEAGRDSLYGDAGNDHLNGGVDDGEYDYLRGGSGRDEFMFDPVQVGAFLWWFDRLYDNRDTPVDFNPAEDTIVRN